MIKYSVVLFQPNLTLTILIFGPYHNIPSNSLEMAAINFLFSVWLSVFHLKPFVNSVMFIYSKFVSVSVV